MNNKYTVGDLFAGAGGLSKAFEQAGAEIVWANEIDKNACKLYRENFSDVCLVEGDIREIEAESIPDIDILVGGFPCQGLSGAGRRFDNRREILFFEILRILNKKKPKAFLLENVKDLVSHTNDRIFKIITEELKNIGYYIKYEILSTKEHGNIPHNKERVYIVGFRDIKEFEIFKFPKKIQLDLKINDIIDTVDKKEEDYYYNENSSYYKIFNKEVKVKGRIYQLKLISRKQPNYDNKIVRNYDICPALTSYISKPQYVPVIKDNYGIRMLTPSECFMMQGFCDFKFSKGFNENRLYKYAAGCSSVKVVKRIAENIIKVLDNKEYLCDDNEVHSDNTGVFHYHKNKLYEFEENSDLPIIEASSNFSVNKKNELKSIQQQVIIEKHINREEENSSKIEDEELNAIKLIKELDEIKPGKEDAIVFHKYITKALNFIFEGYVLRQRIEAEINEGRKRIDIMFDNLAEKGFFCELGSLHKVFCPKIIIECKNYSSTPLNPEIDQLIGRFNNYIGKFGILVCRNIEDKKSLNNRCKDALKGGQGYIIVLSDDDIKELIIFRQRCDVEEINNYLRDKFDELIL
ncbi:DNA (cytosine-5-)-methyltransferase [Clostridium sp. WILCCON 0269]|uniref:Cytosine-specific methyltransferase n=1 Tax=Candidatus Clostridium eludens TaxID=3381663 RepID=A0ABW8SG51_9CLOT